MHSYLQPDYKQVVLGEVFEYCVAIQPALNPPAVEGKAPEHPDDLVEYVGDREGRNDL